VTNFRTKEIVTKRDQLYWYKLQKQWNFAAQMAFPLREKSTMDPWIE